MTAQELTNGQLLALARQFHTKKKLGQHFLVDGEALAAIAGSLTTAGAAGVVIYPPLMGILAGTVGLRNGMLGAALLGIPCAVSVYLARSRASSGEEEEEIPGSLRSSAGS